MNQQTATLRVLYEETPIKPGDCFVQVRRWETAVGEQIELIVEHGQLDETGELNTQCQVVPFFKTVREVLTEIKM